MSGVKALTLVSIGIVDTESVIEATPDIKGGLDRKVFELVHCGYKWRKALGWKREAKLDDVQRMKKCELVELVSGLIITGEMSLCRIQVTSPKPMKPSEQIKRMAVLLEAYKRKVDELMPEGEVFVPEVIQ